MCGLAVLALAAAGCAGAFRMSVQPSSPACRSAVTLEGVVTPVFVRWIAPEVKSEIQALDRWCEGVGPAVVAAEPASGSATADAADAIAVVSWNTHVDGGNILGLVRDLREGRLLDGIPIRNFVLLLQEVYRGGAQVPAHVGRTTRAAGRINVRPPAASREDIVSTARALGLALFYAPSMRNGSREGEPGEDRGNAILSTLPLDGFEAIELPLARQRRVAIGASVEGRLPAGEPWRLKLASVHLENRSGPPGLWWAFSPVARRRQAQALVAAFGHDRPAILGGDLNTWLGTGESALDEIAAMFPNLTSAATQRAFGLLRLPLDHLFVSVQAPWTIRHVIPDDGFGSDHRPLVALIRFTG